MKRSKALLGALLAGVLAVSACGGSEGGAAADGAKPDLAKAKQQAQKFRTISMPDDWNNYGAMWDAVCKDNRLGCDGYAAKGKNRVDASDASSAEVIQFFKDDNSNPGVCGDIGAAFGPIAEEQQVGIGYLPGAAKQLPARYRSATSGWYAHVTGAVSFLVNADKVASPPKSYADLRKPEYRGKVFMKNPMESGTGQATLFSVAAALGKDKTGPGSFDLDAAFRYFKELTDAGQFTKTKYSDEAFEKGETPIVLAYDYVNLQTARDLKAKGVNAQVYVPAEGGVWAPSVIICNRNTDAPDLAKLALDYAISDAGQKLFAQIGAHPIRYVLGDLQLSSEDKENWLPEEQYASVKEFPNDEWPNAAEIAQRWQDEILN